MLGGIHEEPEAGYASRDRSNAFQDKDLTTLAGFCNIKNTISYPSPAFIPTHAIHVCNTKSQQTGKSSGNGTGCEKYCNPSLALVWKVPLRDEQNCTWEETCPTKPRQYGLIHAVHRINSLEQTKQYPNTTELLKVPHEAMAGHHETPSCDDSAHEQRWSIEEIEDCIAGYLYKSRQLQDTWMVLGNVSTYQPKCKG